MRRNRSNVNRNVAPVVNRGCFCGGNRDFDRAMFPITTIEGLNWRVGYHFRAVGSTFYNKGW